MWRQLIPSIWIFIIFLDVGVVYWQGSLIFFIVHITACFILNIFLNDNSIKVFKNGYYWDYFMIIFSGVPRRYQWFTYTSDQNIWNISLCLVNVFKFNNILSSKYILILKIFLLETLQPPHVLPGGLDQRVQ